MSARNNLDRLGVQPDDQSPAPVAAAQQNNSSMEFVAPTEVVDLPTGGKYYPQDHPLHNKGTVEIRYMTARDEDILVNKSYIQKGIVLDKLLESVIIDKSIPVKSLVLGDKNAILVASRITGYGPEYSARVTCPSCMNTADFEFDLNQCVSFKDAENSGISYEETPSGTFLIKTPKTDATIELRPSTGYDEEKVEKTNKMRIKNGLSELGQTDLMMTYMVSVNGNSDRTYINSFVENLPALDARYIRSCYSDLMPSVELAQQYTCSLCDYEQEMEVPFTTEFFWPK